jgi:hypothetical protein
MGQVIVRIVFAAASWVVFWVAKVVFNKNRTKYEFEEEKSNYLIDKYSHLIENKDANVNNVFVTALTAKGEWKVFKTVKGLPLIGKDKDVEVFSIADSKLTDELISENIINASNLKPDT